MALLMLQSGGYMKYIHTLKEESSLAKILNSLDDSELGLKQCEIENKGRGIVATKEFFRGQMIVEYAGLVPSVY